MEARMVSAEDAIYAIIERIDTLSVQLTTQLQNQNLAEAGHQQIHREVQDLQKTIQDFQRTGFDGRRSGGNRVDKSLLPEPYSLDNSKWPSWSLRFRRYMERMHPGVREKMARVEGQSQPLSDDALKALDVSTEVSNDLIDYLGARTEGEAGTILRGAESKHGLEAWRLLSFASGPKGSYSDLRETRTVTRPPRCTKPADLAVHLASWE